MMTSDTDVRCMVVGRPFAGQVTLASTIIGNVPWMEARERAAQEEEDYDPRRHGQFYFPRMGGKGGNKLIVGVWDYRKV